MHIASENQETHREPGLPMITNPPSFPERATDACFFSLRTQNAEHGVQFVSPRTENEEFGATLYRVHAVPLGRELAGKFLGFVGSASRRSGEKLGSRRFKKT